MSCRNLWALASLIFIAIPAHAVAGPADLRTVLNQHVAGSPGVGIAVGVIDRGKTTIYRAGSSGTSRALDEHTLFEVGSVTKTFTATILASMVLDGSVKLDDPVARYLPATVHVPTRDGKQITLLDLATQHSGLPRLPTNMNPSDSDPYAHYSIHDLYTFLTSYQLTRDPGQSFEYSNLGVALLGDALANRAHASYAHLLQTRVLGPLGMTETAISLSASEQQRFAVGHDADNEPVSGWTFEAIAPAGAIRSTIADMLKYVRCNLGQGPLAKACLFAQKPRSTFTGNRIGLIWWTGDVRAIIHHGGDTAGYHASVAIAPDHTKGVVVLTNGGAAVDDIAVHAIDPSLPVAASNFPPVMTLNDATLDSYVGMYEAKAAGLTFAITHVGESLKVQLTGQPAIRMYSSAKDAFYLREVDAQVSFVRAADGSVDGLVLHQGGQDVTAARTSAVATTPTSAPTLAPSAAPSVAAISLDAAALEAYVGTYVSPQGLSFVVTRSGTQLMVQLTGQPSAAVYPTTKDSFAYRVVNAQIDFQRDASGKVATLVLHQNGNDITAALPGVALPQPSFPPVVALDTATLDSYVGTYVQSPSLAFTVSRTGDQLLVQLTGQGVVQVFPSAKDAFYYKIVAAQITFERDASGRVSALVLHQNGRDLRAVKQ
jgi:D-alanyl-D-alanine-carboxypeptidase/D-alanyl-D-alanine-endopeptidase